MRVRANVVALLINASSEVQYYFSGIREGKGVGVERKLFITVLANCASLVT